MINENNWKKYAEENPGALKRNDAELAFMKASSSIVEDKAAPFFTGDYFLGFEIVKTNDTYTKMIGIFAFRVGKNLFYVPVFYMDGAIKGTDLLYSVDDKTFTALTPEWCDYYVNKCEKSEAIAINRSQSSSATQDLQMQWLAYPPLMMKGASENNRIIVNSLTTRRPDYKAKSPLEVFEFVKSASSNNINTQDWKASLANVFDDNVDDNHKPLQTFLKKAGYAVFDKLATWIEDDFEFANNVVKLLDQEDWMPTDVIQAKRNETIKTASQMKKLASISEFEKVRNEASGNILIHKGKFNPNNIKKTAAEQMEKGYTIEDNRVPNNLDVIMGNPEDLFTGIDTPTFGVYDILTTANDIKRMFVIKGYSDYSKTPAILMDVNDEGIISYDDIRHDTNEGGDSLMYSGKQRSAGIHDDQKPRFNDILAQRVDLRNNRTDNAKGLEFDKNDEATKYFEKFLKDKPETGKLNVLYEPVSGYISDEAFYVETVKDMEDGKYQVSAYPSWGYDSIEYSILLHPHREVIITVDKNVKNLNRDLKFFPDTLKWIPLPAEKKLKGDILKSKGMKSDSTSTDTSDDLLQVKQAPYVPGSLATYTTTTKSELNLKQASVKFDRFTNKYTLEMEGNPYKGPFNKVASTVKLMNDLNISEEDATEILDNAKNKGIYRFDHKKIAGRIILNPDPDFFEGFDSDLGVKMEVPETRIVKTQDISIDAPTPRYGDISPTLVNGINTTSPAESNNDTSENVLVRTATPNALATIADATGNKSLFEHGIIASLAKTYDATAYVSEFLPDMQQGADKIGRLIFLLNARPSDFIDFYGSDDLTSLETNLLGTFKQFCEIILELKMKSKDTRENITNTESEQ